MGAFDKLKSLLKITGIDISKLENISLVKDAKDISLIKVDKRKVTINLNSPDLDKQTGKQLKQVINEALNLDAMPVLRDEVEEEVKLISKSGGTPTDEFFKDKISNTDLLILRTAEYINEVYKTDKGKGARLKSELVSRYGERARNITNLCAEGYFEEYFIPLYKALANRPDFNPDEFKDTFNFIVDTTPFTVFLSNSMSEDVAIEAIKDKLARCQRYGMKQLNIHGIGEENLNKIDNILENEEVKSGFDASPTVTKKGNVVHVKIFVK